MARRERRRAKGKSPRTGQGSNSRSRRFLRDTRERPAVKPVAVAAADEHAPLTIPVTERGAAPVAILVFPLTRIRRIVGKCGIGRVVVDLRLRVRHEATLLVFLVELLAREPAVLVNGRIGLEVNEFHLLVLATRHCVNNAVVDVQFATTRLQCFARRTRTVYRDDANDALGYVFHKLAEDAKQLHTDVRATQRLLRGIFAELVAMLASRVTKLVGQIINLAVGDSRCEHGLCHGVISSFAVKLS